MERWNDDMAKTHCYKKDWILVQECKKCGEHPKMLRHFGRWQEDSITDYFEECEKCMGFNEWCEKISRVTDEINLFVKSAKKNLI